MNDLDIIHKMIYRKFSHIEKYGDIMLFSNKDKICQINCKTLEYKFIYLNCAGILDLKTKTLNGFKDDILFERYFVKFVETCNKVK